MVDQWVLNLILGWADSGIQWTTPLVQCRWGGGGGVKQEDEMKGRGGRKEQRKGGDL